PRAAPGRCRCSRWRATAGTCGRLPGPATTRSRTGRDDGRSMMNVVRQLTLWIAVVSVAAAAACGAAAPAGAAGARRRADDRAAGAGARGCDFVGIARRFEPEFTAEAGVLRTRQQRPQRRFAEGPGRERGGVEEIFELGRDRRRTLR